ncbi:S66 peptidase family protein [Nocardioides gansuensis]|uniref:S66 peptidase family protein n=1 Tax=Nocardioides gansuensis TaxID=2138300 RepID=UPI001BA733D8|nr:LD-carboxypeptidase [Nocardioides gansuensis]
MSPGDAVALVAPASWCEAQWLAASVSTIEGWGFQARVGKRVEGRLGYLAGSDQDRAADLNDALRDPEIRAIVTLRGGCGSLRLLADIDTDALRADPKSIVGFSDITAMHKLWGHTGVPSVHGGHGGRHSDVVRRLLMHEPTEPVQADADQFGSELTTTGTATGPLVGGNLEMLARCVGILDRNLDGHILLLEINRSAGLGMVDRALTQLLLSGSLDGVRGVAVGALEGFEGYVDRGWTVLDVLRDRLGLLDVPILAGLPLGHLDDPVPLLLGVMSSLDADAGTLTAHVPTRTRWPA